MRSIVLVVVCLWLTGGPVRAQGTSTASPFLITPGVGIGPLTVGMTITDAAQRLGTPKSTQSSPDGSTRFRWYDYALFPNGSSTVLIDHGGVYATANPLGMIVYVGAFEDSRYKTPQELHVGDRERDILRIMGPPDYTYIEHGPGSEPQWASHTVGYRGAGIAFTVVDVRRSIRYGRVDEISVFAKRVNPVSSQPTR